MLDGAWYADVWGIGVLVFVLCGGIIFELLRLFF